MLKEVLRKHLENLGFSSYGVLCKTESEASGVLGSRHSSFWKGRSDVYRLGSGTETFVKPRCLVISLLPAILAYG